MKKIIALVLALAMILAVATAFAGTITINNVVDGQTYTAYKLLNYTHNGDANTFAYYLTESEYDSGLGAELENAGFVFTQGTDTNYYLTNGEDLVDEGGVALAAAIKGIDLSKALAKKQVTAANSAATFGDLAVGYYFITSTTGTLLTLGSFDAEEVAFDKNEGPGLDKEITGINDQASSHIDESGESADAKIGDVINYTVTITAKPGAENYIFHDQHSAGLTYDPESMTVNGLTQGRDYTIVRNSATPAVAADVTANADVKLGDNITIRFTKAYLDSITQSTSITITYSATLNENAVIDDTGNPNTVKLQYGHTESTEDNPNTPGPDEREDTNTVYTYAIAIKKVNTAGTALAGVTFTFPFKTKAVDGKDYVMYDGVGESTLTTDSNGQITVVGVDAGTYSIPEATTLEGYNVLEDPVEITAILIKAKTTTKHFYIDENGNETEDSSKTEVTYSNDDVAATAVMAINKSGTVLPSTGGIGTTIFYILGGLLVVGAAVILVARRKASN